MTSDSMHRPKTSLTVNRGKSHGAKDKPAPAGKRPMQFWQGSRGSKK